MKKKVVLISTGGTIANGVNPETGLLTSGMMTGRIWLKNANCQLILN